MPILQEQKSAIAMDGMAIMHATTWKQEEGSRMKWQSESSSGDLTETFYLTILSVEKCTKIFQSGC